MEMDAVSRTNGAALPGDTVAPQGSNKLGKDEFLKLLMAQLGHQDPTAPVDSEAFVAQLAQFAHLELSQNANAQLESLLLAQTAANQTSMTNFVGKDVVYRTDRLTLEAGRAAVGGALLAAPAENVTAVVTDQQGKTIRTMQLGRQPAGSLAISWDGRDERGNTVAPGDYKLRVTAQDADGKSIEVEQRGTGHVTGVAYEGGVPELRLGSIGVKVPDVVEIKERTAP